MERPWKHNKYKMIRASLSHVALDTGYNFWKEYILRFLKTAPFKNLKQLVRKHNFLQTLSRCENCQKFEEISSENQLQFVSEICPIFEITYRYTPVAGLVAICLLIFFRIQLILCMRSINCNTFFVTMKHAKITEGVIASNNMLQLPVI